MNLKARLANHRMSTILAWRLPFTSAISYPVGATVAVAVGGTAQLV